MADIPPHNDGLFGLIGAAITGGLTLVVGAWKAVSHQWKKINHRVEQLETSRATVADLNAVKIAVAERASREELKQYISENREEKRQMHQENLSAIHELRKEIGAVHARVDELYKR